MLADIPVGGHHAELSSQTASRERIDVAIPLAQFYISQARTTGDLRFLGYADRMLAPWVFQSSPSPAALVLRATVQQSRHDFDAALDTLDQALAVRPADPQAWLTRATVLRVLGRYTEAEAACAQFSQLTDLDLGSICTQSVRALHGELAPAYQALARQSPQGLQDAELAWRGSELGEMAVRLGREADAERWFKDTLRVSPQDNYVRAAYADLLLSQQRDGEVIALLNGRDSIEPLLLRVAIAQLRQGDPQGVQNRDRLRAAFDAENLRGDAVHRREQARFLLQIERQPKQALAMALANWDTQREPEDALLLIEAARAAGEPQQAAPALEFVQHQGVRDVRISAAAGAAL